MSLNHRQDYNREIRDWLLRVFDRTSRIDVNLLKKRPCPLCGCSNDVFFANNGYLNYSRCPDCTLVYQNPSTDACAVNDGFEGDDDLLREYFAIAMKYKSGIPARPDPMLHPKLRDIYAVKQNGRLLDIGCSLGDFLHLAKHFYEVEGVEVNPLTAEFASKSFHVHRGFLAELNLPAVYDVVTLHQILYGVPDPVQLLKEIHEVLQPRGILYINTPNADSYASRLYGGKSCHLYGYTSLNVFSPSSLTRLAKQTGYEVISMRSEWLDIYASDLQEFYDHPHQFIHKRNCHLPDYEGRIAKEDACQQSLDLNLGVGGNYLVCVLQKVE